MKYGHVKRLPRSKASRRSRQRLADEATPAERVFLKALRGKQEPHRFQHAVHTAEAPTGYYVVDFYLPKRSLLIELDGKPHSTERGKWNDLLRTEAILRARPELELKRAWNAEVLADPEALLDRLTALPL